LEGVPDELAYRLRPAEQLLWWGRPRKIWPVSWMWRYSRLGLATMLVQAIVIVTAIVAIVVPQGWHPVVALIFRIAFSASGFALIVTLLTIVVLQRRQRCYAITRDRALTIGGFWADGSHASALEQLVELSVKARPDGEGTIWFGVVHPDSFRGPGIAGLAGAGDDVRPRFEHIADARKVFEILGDARAAAKARGRGRDQR
jgi:hypothetical protein